MTVNSEDVPALGSIHRKLQMKSNHTTRDSEIKQKREICGM